MSCRELLADSEKMVPKVSGTGARALDVLENMDRIAELWPQLEAAGVDLRPEAGRWQGLQASVHSRAPDLLRELRTVGGIGKARAERHAGGRAAWWWYLDEEIGAKLRRRVLTAGAVVLGIVIIGAALVWLLNRLNPMDPAARAALGRQMAGQAKIQNSEDYRGALADFQAATALTPDESDNWFWLGGTQQKLGDAAGAQVSFARARALMQSDLDYLMTRIPVYVSLMMPAEAIADVNAVLAITPDSPQAYYYLASVYELQGKLEDAVAALQRTSDLADAKKQPDLTAMARYRMAMLTLQLQSQSLNPPTATPAAP